MFSYKPDQGVYARGTAFWALCAYSWLAGKRFYYFLQRADWANKRLLDDAIPVIGVHLTPGFISGVLLFAGMAYGAWRFVNYPKMADLLIDTEAEMRKVTWPSFEDSKKSSMVVIGCVVFMLVFLFVTDFAFEWLFMDLVY